jgi:glycosyltransferase involved in cell wall biosynthesis
MKSKDSIKIHFHTDLWYFGGSERMLALLINEMQNSENYKISMSFRKSKRYFEEFSKEIKKLNFPLFQLFSPYPPFFMHYTDRPRHPNSVRNFLNEISIRIFHYLFFLIEVFQFAKLMKIIKPDVVHLNNGGYPGARSVRAAAVASRLCKIKKIIMVVNNIAVPYSSIYRWVDYPLDRLVANSVTTFITSSRRAQEQLIKVLRPKARVLKIQNIIEPLNEVKYDLNIVGKVKIVAVGNLEVRKGHIYLLEAISRIKSEHPEIYNNLEIWIMGSGTNHYFLESKINELGLISKFSILPYQPNTRYIELIAKSHLFVHPSISYEDSPNVITTALALGKPIIATDVGGASELVKDKINGLIVEPKNSDSLYQALLLVLTNYSLLKEFSKQSRMIYEKDILQSAALEQYFTLYGH